eukprot:jgi/Psemu1/319516/estExt_fgenesh1_pm.C_2380008
MATSPQKQNAVLKYFDLKGAAETCRVLLAIGGEDYDDARYKFDPATFKSPTFTAAKESGELKANLNRAPVLVTSEGTTIGQSKAIERYLAKRFGLMGNIPEEEAVIDCIAEHCRDVKDAAARKGFSKFSRDKTEDEKTKARAEWFEEDLPTMLGKIDDYVKSISTEEGFAIGSSLSYADVAIWALLRDCSPSDAEDTSTAATDCETLNCIANAVAGHPAVSKWVKTRPESMF